MCRPVRSQFCLTLRGALGELPTAMRSLGWTASFALAFSSLAGSAVAQAAETSPAEPAPATEAETAPAAEVEAPAEAPIEAPADPNAWETAPATRRSGFTIGTSFGFMAGTSSGYPNAFSKIGNPAFHASVTGIGGGGFVWLGGALADWLNFGLGGGGGSFGDADFTWSGGAFLFRVEAFPLFSLGGGYRDLGLSFDFGTGPGTIVRKADDQELSGNGVLSLVGVGVFWEPWRIASGHLVAGPAVSFVHGFSEWQTTSFGMIGLRGAFYGGP